MHLTREFWVRIAIAGVAIAIAVLVARLIDRRIARRPLQPGTITRYRILRQSILWGIVFIGILSALLVIPEVRAVAVGILASSAVIGLVLGFAAQRTIGNFIAGLLIAFTQPVRLGDEIEVEATRGIVEEVGLIYTWVRTNDNDRLAIPNEKLASETIRNSTIRDPRRLVEVSVQVPAGSRLRAAVKTLEPGTEDVQVTALDGDEATIVVRRYIDPGESVEQAATALWLEINDRLK